MQGVEEPDGEIIGVQASASESGLYSASGAPPSSEAMPTVVGVDYKSLGVAKI